jgi:hypothetical protein
MDADWLLLFFPAVCCSQRGNHFCWMTLAVTERSGGRLAVAALALRVYDDDEDDAVQLRL